MTEPVTLDDIKTHLGFGPGAAGDDAYIGSLLVAARVMVERDTRRTIFGAAPTLVGDDLETAKQAIRLIVGAWYANREAVTATDARSAPIPVPMAATWILASLRAWDSGAD